MVRFLSIICFFLYANVSWSQVVINEYSTSNLDVIKDSFNKTEDWIELFNTSTLDVDLSGWYLSDKENKPMKWQFPSGTVIRANGFITVLCSGKDGLYSGEYHTNFKLTQTEGNDIIIISNEQGIMMDMTNLNLTLTEHSNCRSNDGQDLWMVCTTPTFGSSNNESTQAIRYTQTPDMSLEPGFYSGEQIVSITNNEANSVMRYTLDGSNPLSDSPIYSGPITISTTTVIKAKAFSNSNDILPGKLDFRTFFIDESFSLPVYSIAADRVTNLANGAGVLLPIGSLEYFKDNRLEASSFGELNRHGQDSWVLDHRSIDWISRDEMGYSKAVNAPIISSSDRDSYQRFMFRNSGDDNYPAIDGFDHEGSTHLRDEYVQAIALENGMHLDVRKPERVILFLNGEYWGVYGMREKIVDHDYTDEYYNQGKEDIQFLSTWATTEIEYGGQQALDDWINLRDFILSNDMSDDGNYKIIMDSIDLTSLIDYFTMNQVTVAVDWLNYNTGWWRGRNPNGTHKKWGYILWDLDATFDYYINYTGVPDRSSEASICDIFAISDEIDMFFDNDFGTNIGDVRDCPSIINGSSPYPADDTIFVQTVATDPFCCQEWDMFCELLYDDISDGGVSLDISMCPIIIDSLVPYDANDPILEIVIDFNVECCSDWTQDCQDAYNFFGDTGTGGVDISGCTIFANGTSPYSSDDPKMPFVIEINPDCCNEWGVSCQRDYELLGGDQFKEADDPFLSGITGNIGKHEKILLKLIEESPTFQQLYFSRFADLMNTAFSCENMNDLLDRMIAEIESEMPRQIARWGGSMSEWESNLERLRRFIDRRCAFINDNSLDCFNMTDGQYNVTLRSEPEGVGEINFNTLFHQDLPWSGDYFSNMDNLVQAGVQDAYRSEYEFSHWESVMGNNISPDDMSRNMTYRLSMPDTLIAHYKMINNNVVGDIILNEFMASNNSIESDQDGEFDDWIELYNRGDEDVNISGYYLSDNEENLSKYAIPDGTTLAANEYLIIWADEDGSQDGLHANFKLSKSGETILLMDRDTSILDSIVYNNQDDDISYARLPNGTGSFQKSEPTFNANNDFASSIEDIIPEERLVIYPNPTTDKVSLQLLTNGQKLNDIVISDMLGNSIYVQNNINDYQLTIDLGHIPSGIYLVTANQLYTSKLIKN